MATYNRNEVAPVPVIRLSTGFEELDWIYGETDGRWGYPQKAISLWAGQSGTGKSRTAIEICNKIASRGGKVLYFQAESDVGAFCEKIKYDSFRVSDSKDLEGIYFDISNDQPEFVVIDSVNMIKEFGSGTKKQIEVIIDQLRLLVNMGCHIVLLGQLNQDGTIKGSTTLPHLVDIALNIEKDGAAGCFCIKVGMKHRFGRTGKSFMTGWRHTDSGVENFVNFRQYDKKWNETHSKNVAPRKRFSFFSKK